MMLLSSGTTHGALCLRSRTSRLLACSSEHAVSRLHAQAPRRQGAHRYQTSAQARHAGGQPSPADLVGQAVRLRGLPQASPGRRILLEVLGVRSIPTRLCTEQDMGGQLVGAGAYVGAAGSAACPAVGVPVLQRVLRAALFAAAAELAARAAAPRRQQPKA